MADLLTLEQDERRWRDDAARIFVDEIMRLIADRLGREGAPEWEMAVMLDGVPAAIVLEVTDVLGVVVQHGVWRVRRRA